MDRNALDEAQICLAALNGENNPKRHAWTWDFYELGIPGWVYCADCGTLAAFDGIDANCEVNGFNCPPTVFDPSDHDVWCPAYRARPCVAPREIAALAGR